MPRLLNVALLVPAAVVPLLAAPSERKIPASSAGHSALSALPAKQDSGESAQVAGSSLYRTYCASCHGLKARGDGPLADELRMRPPDLTLLAQHNGGTFDKEKVRRIVDGRNPVKGHGGPDMPVWGDVFKRSEEGYDEKKVTQRIDALIEYLAGLQRQE